MPRNSDIAATIDEWVQGERDRKILKRSMIDRRTGNDCPTAAYLVQPPTPVNFPTNGCGQVQFGSNAWGCGCGCAA